MPTSNPTTDDIMKHIGKMTVFYIIIAVLLIILGLIIVLR